MVLFIPLVVHAKEDIGFRFTFLEKADSPEELSTTLELMFLFTILSLAPSIILMMTSYTRFAIIFSFLKKAIGTQETPPNMVLNGLALFLTFMVMAPVTEKINEQALTPYFEGDKDGNRITQKVAIKRSRDIIHEFLLLHTSRNDIRLFMDISETPDPKEAIEIPLTVLIPAFVTSELTIAFKIGFLLFLPFFVIDLVVSGILMSMGMMMLPPILISLPFKILLFVMIDGWNLLIQEMVRGFTGYG